MAEKSVEQKKPAEKPPPCNGLFFHTWQLEDGSVLQGGACPDGTCVGHRCSDDYGHEGACGGGAAAHSTSAPDVLEKKKPAEVPCDALFFHTWPNEDGTVTQTGQCAQPGPDGKCPGHYCIHAYGHAAGEQKRCEFHDAIHDAKKPLNHHKHYNPKGN